MEEKDGVSSELFKQWVFCAWDNGWWLICWPIADLSIIQNSHTFWHRADLKFFQVPGRQSPSNSHPHALSHRSIPAPTPRPILNRQAKNPCLRHGSALLRLPPACTLGLPGGSAPWTPGGYIPVANNMLFIPVSSTFILLTIQSLNHKKSHHKKKDSILQF